MADEKWHYMCVLVEVWISGIVGLLVAWLLEPLSTSGRGSGLEISALGFFLVTLGYLLMKLEALACFPNRCYMGGLSIPWF